ncbi:CGNR zinc finger domain-containing protein [Micromonospora sp. NPDC093277]|uniref:CGNR zinc finger domain-containing protein n=1 Tax=Micromonospora sp. NPDC093277 TaxID=3364291 RepID=UPI0038138B9D
MAQQLTLALAGTIRHDGSGGVTDDLADVPGLARWLHEQAPLLRPYAGSTEPLADVVDERSRQNVVAVRRALRTLFAEAVRPGPPSRADSGALLSVPEAIAQLNQAAAAMPVRPVLDWPSGADPTLTWQGQVAEVRLRLPAALARAAVEFLASPAREQLRACPAPRCVRYFVKEHPRQEWCKPSCGNRARVARHYQRHSAGR